MLNMADSRFHTLRIHRPFFQRPQNTVQQFFLIKRLTCAIAFDKSWHHQYSRIIGGKTIPTVDTFPPPANQHPLTGKAADAALGDANITVNKNAVPNDPQSPFVTSGIRVGTPAVTTRGFGKAEVADLAGWMCDIMDDVENRDTIDQVREKVLEVCRKFPVYGRAGT